MKRLFCTSRLIDPAHAARARYYRKKPNRLINKRPVVEAQRKRNGELQEKASESSLDWRIMGATILQRYAVVRQEMAPWERDFHELQEKIDGDRRSHFLQHYGHLQVIPDNPPSVEEIVQSMPFEPLGRETEADEKNDRRSLLRKLDKSLYLIVKRNRKDSPWQFPQGKMLPKESALRQVISPHVFTHVLRRPTSFTSLLSSLSGCVLVCMDF
jgi:hypothetical protein